MLIGITGQKTCGKDTSSDYLVSKYGYHKQAFANKLKSICNNIFPFIYIDEANKETQQEVQIYDSNIIHALKILGVDKTLQHDLVREFYRVFSLHILFLTDSGCVAKLSPREAYQLFGTDFARKYISDDIWLKNVDVKSENVVISDLRFNNEAEFLKTNDAVIIKIINPRVTSLDFHASEQGIDYKYIDYIIDNKGTLEDLYDQLDMIMLYRRDK